ncbi:portal protein [Burkholderia gladioli]|uniref:portal protein n=1 Tax=Burkholderia gladioli TaxID=28095 RepID=UPI00164103D8|nr:portal protein [Burkholderia gladioli]
MDGDDHSLDDERGTSNAAVLARVKRRWKRCRDWEGDSHDLGLRDMQFLVGDSENGFQWDELVRSARTADKKPCLTINKTHVHWLSVVNDGKAQKPSVKVHPVSNGATYESAQAFESVIRHIEYLSNAQTAYDRALEFQVGGGIGFWRIQTDYIDDNAFDQQIFIRQVDDPFSIYMDPDIKEQDGSDATFAFVFSDIPNEEYLEKYGREGLGVTTTIETDPSVTGRQGYTRILEYFEVVEKNDWMYAFHVGAETRTVRWSQMDDQLRKTVRDAEDQGAELIKRRIKDRQVWWYLVAGEQVIERRRWVGKYIPLVRCIGEEFVLDGHLERKGLVRYLIDPQKMYNFNASSQSEFVQLQGKTPWIASPQAIAGYEQYYKTANYTNHAWLPYNAYDDAGQPLQPPVRATPPTISPAYEAGMEAAAEQMKMASGQYDALMGAPSNETTGVAIDRRARQGERATYHFIDGQAKAIRFTGKILIDLIPKVMSTERVIRTQGEDQKETTLEIAPKSPLGISKRGDVSIFNPSVGTFDVVADVGPNFQTRRAEAFNAFKEIMAQNSELVAVAGDLFLRAGDFPMADELAERLENWIRMSNPAVLGEAPSPQMQQLQQQVQQLSQQLQAAQQALSDKSETHRLQQQRNDIDYLNHLALRTDEDHQKAVNAYKAVTDRLKALGIISPEVSAETIADALREPLPGIEHAAGDPMNEGGQLPSWLPMAAQPSQTGFPADGQA